MKPYVELYDRHCSITLFWLKINSTKKENSKSKYRAHCGFLHSIMGVKISELLHVCAWYHQITNSTRTVIYTCDLPSSFRIFEILDETSQVRTSTICVFVWSHSRIFHSLGDDTIASEVLKILTYTRPSWTSSRDGSLTRHNYSVTRVNPLKLSSPRTRDTHTCCRAFGSGTVTTCLKDSGLSRSGIEL